MSFEYKTCENCGNTLAYCSCSKNPESIKEITYEIKNLDCINCSQKLEDKLNTLPAVLNCNISFPNKKLKLKAANQEELIPEIEQICKEIEPDVEIINNNYKTIFLNINGLDCANCAKKVENALNNSSSSINANLNFTSGTLIISDINPINKLNQYQSIIDSVEDGVEIKLKQRKKEEKVETKILNTDLIQIILGTLIFSLSWLLESYFSPNLELILQLFAYIILGGEVLIKAFKNILKGDFFDENFLMSIATIGAFLLGDYHEGVGVMLFYRIGEYFQDYAVNKSRKQIIDAIDMRPETALLLIEGSYKEVPIEAVKLNDTILVRPGDRIPLDGEILKGESRLDTSPITGEFVPRKVKKGEEVLSGCINQDGQLEILVKKDYSESLVTKILDSVENAAANKPKIDKFITRFSKIYTPIVLLIALVVAIVPSLITGNWYHWLYTAISFLVISCPCALVLSVPLAYFCGIGAASKLGILFKSGLAIEAINNLKIITFDKTGTLTKGDFKVQSIESKKISPNELLKIAGMCEYSSTHPIAQSIRKELNNRKLILEKPENIKEIPGKGIKVKENDHTYLCGNKKLLEENNIIVPENSDYGTIVYLADNDNYLGKIIISDTIKNEAKGLIKKLKSLNMRTAMLTGDNTENASHLSSNLNIDEFKANLLPDQKLSELNNLRNQYGDIMFIGDGINDSPVLAGANIGAAMGKGSDAAIEAADIVFMSEDLNAINTAYQIGKKTAKIAWQNVYLAIAVKAIILLIGLFGFANMWLAVFADTGVAILCILNSLRILYSFKNK